MRFNKFFDTFKSIWIIAIGASITGPLALWSIDISPPWPISVSRIAVLFCALAIILSYTLSQYIKGMDHRNPRQSGNLKKKIVKILLPFVTILFFGLAICYFYLYSTYVVTIQKEATNRNQQLRYVIGFKVNDTIKTNDKSNRELLLDHLLETEKVWSLGSIRTVKLLLLFTYLSMFSVLYFTVPLLLSLFPAQDESS